RQSPGFSCRRLIGLESRQRFFWSAATCRREGITATSSFLLNTDTTRRRVAALQNGIVLHSSRRFSNPPSNCRACSEALIYTGFNSSSNDVSLRQKGRFP